ncbi:MAG: cyclic nucleotide-binding domain-containing protein [Proteobacteria bacterium]|nr:cyclic nucleotide-binding domain-containing protein [Pseudomonadota bacterium]MBU1610760.1 cyclic nucleotide-binding domain-containing protein [Pseudomonadota bacterium]
MNIEWNKISLFEGFTPAWLEQVKAIFEPLHLPAGQDLIREGDPGDELYILVEGKVRITKSMLIQGMRLPIMESDDPRKVLATLDGRQYPVFGEIALIDEDIRSATISVIEDADFIYTNRERFFDLLNREPQLGCQLFAILGKRLAATVRRNNSELIKLSTALALALSRFRS